MPRPGQPPAPLSRIPEDRRGPVRGRFCLACNSIYPLHQARHVGKPMFGKDHVSAPCRRESQDFDADASWWEDAVEVLPPPPEADPAPDADS